MKHSAFILSFFAFMLWTADQAHGQAIIGYGINVGRAGAAGAAAGASGAGAAGIFSKLNSRLDEKPKTQSGARTAQPEFDSEELKRARQQRLPPSFSTSGTTVETSSGVRISGHRSTPPRVMPTRYQARSLDYEPAPFVPAPSASPSPALSTAAQAGQPSAAASAEAEQTPESETEGETAEAGEPAPVSAPSAQEAPRPDDGRSVVIMNARIGSADQGSPAPSAGTQAAPSVQRLLEIDSVIADIPEGTSIEAVIERFGNPIFKMVGLPGQDYSEKYIFRTADGRRFTVFTQHGLVAEILVEPLVLGNRAAL